jgi:hypothetical protein
MRGPTVGAAECRKLLIPFLLKGVNSQPTAIIIAAIVIPVIQTHIRKLNFLPSFANDPPFRFFDAR